MKWIQNLSYPSLLIAALLLAIIPFGPNPHLLEKLRMLINGELIRPLDIFDLFFHGSPLILLALKIYLEQKSKRSAASKNIEPNE